MTKTFVRSNDLVFDLGMNDGNDTDYYLRKGFRVVAVEANPLLCDRARERFCEAIENRRLHLLNLAVWSGYAQKEFFINHENDHWSSLDVGWAGRNGTRYSTVTIDCVPVGHLFALYGVPMYMKVDVEGVDDLIIGQLEGAPYVPYYLSLEDCRFGYQYLQTLSRVGYGGFKLQDQSLVGEMRDESIGHAFLKGSSGPFGEDVAGEWLTLSAMEEKYSTEVRDRNLVRLAPTTHWWDIHACAVAAQRII